MKKRKTSETFPKYRPQTLYWCCPFHTALHHGQKRPNGPKRTVHSVATHKAEVSHVDGLFAVLFHQRHERAALNVARVQRGNMVQVPSVNLVDDHLGFATKTMRKVRLDEKKSKAKASQAEQQVSSKRVKSKLNEEGFMGVDEIDAEVVPAVHPLLDGINIVFLSSMRTK